MRFNKKGLFVMFFVITSLFMFFSFEVKGANTHVCEWTNNNDFCVESTDEEFKAYNGCRPGYKTSFATIDQVENCKRGTCVPNGLGACLSNKFKISCIYNNSGRWYNEPLSNVADCQIGCCNIANSLCGLQQKKVCIQDLAKGNVNAYTASITDSVSCDNSCREADKGCCKSGDNFRFSTRENCKGDFFVNTNCRDVSGYNAISHRYKSCGDNTEDNDKFDVYWYDSNNVREDLANKCDYPYQICSDIDGKGGKDAECVSSNCVDSCPDCVPGQFRTGESVCLNTLETFYGNEKRSKGLHNYVLRCQWGQVTPQDTDNNRLRKCVQTTDDEGRVRAKFEANNYVNCASCGQGSTTDIAGFVPILGPPISAGLLFGIGSSCGKNAWDLGLGESCSDRGDCRYDSDFIWTPIGSCNPKYSPGTTDKCGECGKGGDSATNLCTKKECNSLGDCQFKSKTLSSEALLATGGLALGTCATAWTVTYVTCNVPIFGQASCPVWIGSTATLCNSVGSHALYWGLIGAVYGTGAIAATQDTQEAGDFLVNGKVPIGLALAVGNGVLANAPEDNRILSPSGFATIVRLDEPYEGETPDVTIRPSSNKEITENTAAAAAASALFGVKKEGVGFISKTSNSLIRFLEKQLSMSRVILALTFVTTSASFQTGECMTEQPLNTNEFCETCGAGEGQWYCTQERCNILGGSNCRFFPANGTAYGKCVSIPKDDNTAPSITRIESKFLDNTRITLKEFSKDGKSLSIDEKLSWNIVTLRLNVKTNEKASCTFNNLRGSEYGNGAWFDENVYQINRNVELNITEADKINGITLYFKCDDLNGNKIDKNDDTNFISFSFEPRPDTSPPIIQKINPRNSILLPASKTSIELSVIAFDENDVAECKYTKSNNTNYNEFENVFTRGNRIGCQTTTKDDCREFTTDLSLTSDWGKISKLNNRNITSYSLNINCKDNSGNVGFEVNSWTMFTTELFKVTINNPIENEQLFNRRPLINVTTTEATICNYTLSEKEYVLSKIFDFSHEKNHEENLAEGNYNMKVECNDIAGNEVTEERNFQVLIDTNNPNIIRLFKTQGKLCIQLNEEAECRYEHKQIFPGQWDNGNGMISGSLKNSYCAALDEDKVYYVMCRDTWGNDMTAVIYP